VINARFPIDYHLDVFAARVRAHVRWLVNHDCDITEQYASDGKVMCVALTRGQLFSKQFEVIKVYYGKVYRPII